LFSAVNGIKNIKKNSKYDFYKKLLLDFYVTMVSFATVTNESDIMEPLKINLGDILGRLVGITFKTIMARMTANLEKCGLKVSFEEMIVLINTWHQPGISQQWFVEMIGKDKTKVTRVIDTLESKDLVVRIEDKHDRRKKLIYLTNSGKELIAPCIKVVEETNREMVVGIDPENIEICRQVLKQVNQNLSK